MQTQLTSYFFLFVMIGTMLYSCDRDSPSVDFDYNYYPTNVGHWVTYEVDSIVIDKQINKYDTAHYYIKEKIASKFKDTEDRTAYRIVRYKRRKKNQPWKIYNVWYAVLTQTRLERVEENLRFIKLVFPVTDGETWKGNSLLNPDEITNHTNFYPCPPKFEDWEYKYESVDESLSINGLTFDSVATVTEEVSSNLVDTVHYVVQYARDVGMIYRVAYHKQDDNATANWANPSCANIRIMRITDFAR